jgi:hypothetical protein
MVMRIRDWLLPPCQSDISHERQHNPRKGPTKQGFQKVGYPIVENVEVEFALSSSPESMYKNCRSDC